MADAPAVRKKNALAPRRAPVGPDLVANEPAPRNVGQMGPEDRTRFVHFAIDAARERLRAYRVVCVAAQCFYAQRGGGVEWGGASKRN